MEFISDVLLASAALGAMIYCLILSRRLAKLNDLDKGMGGAIAVLSVQVDDMTAALGKAQSSAALSRSDLLVLTERSEKAAHRLELILASMHDLSELQPKGAAPAKNVDQVAEDRFQFSSRNSGSDLSNETPTWRTRRSVKEAV